MSERYRGYNPEDGQQKEFICFQCGDPFMDPAVGATADKYSINKTAHALCPGCVSVLDNSYQQERDIHYQQPLELLPKRPVDYVNDALDDFNKIRDIINGRSQD